MNDVIFIVAITLKSSPAVLLASLGELISERGGILNLGVEGMMLVGALAGFVTARQSASLVLGLCNAMAAAGLLALLHAFLCVHLRADQVISGLAVTILGTGLSSFLGRPFIGQTGLHFNSIGGTWIDGLPLIGPLLAQQNLFGLLSLVAVPALIYLLGRTWLGLYIRAAGQDPVAADAAGVPVAAIRYGCTLCGGCMAGLAGAYLSLAYTPGWKEGMTGGQGWIAIAMVIFATWHPLRALLGALLFGLLNALQFYFQATGIELIPAYILHMLPYLLTVGVLVLVTVLEKPVLGSVPAALGKPFSREE